MAKTDWTMEDVVQPSDMNQIGEEINQLREDVDNTEVPPASTTQAGIVQLSNVVNSTSELLAATPKAVKTAYDHAEAAFQLGNERKEEVVDVLIAKGISASTSDLWDSLIGKLSSIIKATGNATVGDVLASKTFSNAGENGLTGTMPDRGAVNATLTQQGQEYTIPSGRHSGAGKVSANIANLTAANVRNGATVGGVAGTFSQFSNGATAAQILTGRSAAVNGANVNGSMPNCTGHVTGQGVSRSGTTLRIRPQSGYYPGDTGNSVQIADANFVAGNIRKGVTLFGLPGTAPEPLITPFLFGTEGVLWVQGNGATNFHGSLSKGSSLAFQAGSAPGRRSQAAWVTDTPVDVTNAQRVIMTGRISTFQDANWMSVALCVSDSKMGGSNEFLASDSFTNDPGNVYYSRGYSFSLAANVSNLSGAYYIRAHVNVVSNWNIYVESVVLA